MGMDKGTMCPRDLTPEEFERFISSELHEINRYKWLESEKLGYDIGRNRAAREWAEKYADGFSRFWQHAHAVE